MSRDEIYQEALRLKNMANKSESPKEAAVLYEKAAKIFEMVSFEEAIEAYNLAGDEYKEIKNKEKAIECYLAAGKLALRKDAMLATVFFEEAAKLGSIDGLDSAIMLLRTELMTRRPIVEGDYIELANLKHTLAQLLLLKGDSETAREILVSASFDAIKGDYPFFAGLLCIKAAELSIKNEKREIASRAYHYFAQGAFQEKNRDYEWFAKNICMQAVAAILAGKNPDQLISQCKNAAIIAQNHAKFPENKRLFQCIASIIQKKSPTDCPRSVVLDYIKRYIADYVSKT